MWQPIETAPKDGDPFNYGDPILGWDGKEIAIIEWLSTEWSLCHDYEGLVGFHPTHWMPLPAPPLANT